MWPCFLNRPYNCEEFSIDFTLAAGTLQNLKFSNAFFAVIGLLSQESKIQIHSYNLQLYDIYNMYVCKMSFFSLIKGLIRLN